jgi:uncharacterized phage protein gp47/JayE
MSELFVTSSGFQKKTLAEIKTELETEFQSIFGEDIDLDPSGPIGQYIGLLSKLFADLWDVAEEIYTSRDPSSATGTSLDNIVLENGIIRQAATETTILDVFLTGDDSTVIAAGKRAKNPNQIVEYILDSSVTIDKTAARQGKISITSVVVSNDYTVTIDSVNYTHTATGGQDEEDILDAIKVLIDAGAWGGTTSVDGNELTLLASTDFSFDITGDLSIDAISSVGDFTADTAGAYTIAANTLTEIVTPVSGWDEVNNINAGLTGTNQETDSELRIRREFSVNNGFGTDDSIRESILDNVDGITACTVTSNRTNTTDSESRPAHSFEAVVVGGDDTEIAEEILRVQSAGIGSYGNTTENVTDSQGYTQIIKFSRPVSQYIWVRIYRDYYDEEAYPDDGDDLIKESIVDWSLDLDNINIGVDVIRQKLSTPIYEIAGIGDITIEIDATATPGGSPSYASSNIVISAREIAVFATGRITVLDMP